MKGATPVGVVALGAHAVSIHAPMKGATESNGAYVVSLKGFNPRPHEGGDDIDNCPKNMLELFQSTPP